MTGIADFERLFNPSSIAIVGASNELFKSGGRFFRGLMTGGYKGGLYAVNPNEPVVFEQKSYRSVADVPGDIDLAVLAVPSRIVPQVMADCARKRVRFVIVHSAGFSELGPDGRELEREMLKYAAQSGTRVIGPNCMGMYSPAARINTIAAGAGGSDIPGPVAFVGQSGWVTENVIVMGHERGLRFSKVVSIGNQSDVTIEELIAYFGDDPETRVIGFYAEGLKHGREFLETARRVSNKKPIIAWKGGRSAGGARAASSHTGSLAGNGAIMDDVLKQCGAVIARDLDDLMDLMVGFTSPVLPRGNKVGLLVEAGGGAVSGCDAAELLGLEIPVLSEQAQKDLVTTLTGVIPPFAAPKNPVDIVWAPAQNAAPLFSRCSRIILGETDAVVMLNYLNYDDVFARAMADLRDETGKPLMVIPGHVTERRDGMALLTRNGIPAFTTPRNALKALAAMAQYARRRST